MFRLSRLTLIASALVVAACSQGPDKPAAPQQAQYTIQLREPATGDVLEIDRLEKTGTTFQDRQEEVIVTLLYRETVLEGTAGKDPKRLQRKYTKGQMRMRTVDLADPEPDKVMDFPYVGKTMLSEVSKGNYHLKLADGTEITEKALLDSEERDRELVTGFDRMFKQLLPATPLPVGVGWSFEGKPLLKQLYPGVEVTAAIKSACNGTLTRVYDQDGRRYGTFELTITNVNAQSKQIASIKLNVQMNVDACIDGSGTFTTLDCDYKLTGTRAFTNLPVTIKSSLKHSRKQVAKE